MNMYIDIYFDDAFKTAWDMIMVIPGHALPKNLLENFKQVNNNKFTQFRFLTKKYSHGKQHSVRSCFKNGDGNYFDWIELGCDGIYSFTFKIYTKDTLECLFFGVFGGVKYIQSLKQIINEGDFTVLDLLRTKIDWIDSRKDLECFLA